MEVIYDVAVDWIFCGSIHCWVLLWFNRGAVEGFKRAILMMGMIGKAASEGKNFEEKEGEK